MHPRIALALLSLAGVVAACCRGAPGAASAPKPLRAPDYGARFGQHWHDGKAELAGYDLVFPRYGQPRSGTAVAIFVTEPFDSKTHIKPEDPARGDVEVLKLNLAQDFPTGVYDYNLMTSAFVATQALGKRPAGSALKVSFSAQEWCGHAYMQARLENGGARFDSHSYFEGEGDQRGTLDYPAELSGPVLSEDALLLWARGLAGPVVPPGGQVELPILRSLQRVRLSHVELAWDRARLSREPGSREVDVPAGSFEVERLRAELRSAEGEPLSSWLFEVEKAFPRRIVRFTRDDGLQATLRGVARLSYWKLNGLGKEQLLEQLGLRPRPAAMP